MEQKEKVYDFTKVKFEVSFGEFQEADLSQVLGNVIHQATGDIGLDEVARTIYKEGKAEIPGRYVDQIVGILKNPNTPMMAAAKVAIIDILSNQS